MNSVKMSRHLWEIYRDKGWKIMCIRFKKLVQYFYWYPLLDYLGFDVIDDVYSDEWFESFKDDQWRSDANLISSVLHDKFNPDSVLDLGCGIGLHLKYFYDQGVNVMGVDGAKGAKKHSIIPAKKIKLHDLRAPFYPKYEYDLLICFETAEHIPSRYSEVLINSISRCSDIVAFTAATPGQGGNHHVNEQPHDFWIKKFSTHGYSFEEMLSDDLKDKMNAVEETTWIPKNLLIFTR